MFAYADSSLLMKLYVREPNSLDAIAAVQKAGKPLLFTPLHNLEISGSIRCNVKRGTLTASKAAQALRLLRHDLKNGVYVTPTLDWPQVFKQAHRLSQRHSRPLLARSLDLLHAASALELGALDFLSFDERQSKVARVLQMKVAT